MEVISSTLLQVITIPDNSEYLEYNGKELVIVNESENQNEEQ